MNIGLSVIYLCFVPGYKMIADQKIFVPLTALLFPMGKQQIIICTLKRVQVYWSGGQKYSPISWMKGYKSE